MNCLPLFHKWSRWGDVMVNDHGQAFQYKHCLKCRKAAVRWISSGR